MMNIVLCHWFWVSIIPSLWWGVVVLTVLIMALRIAKSIIESQTNQKQQIIEEQHRYEKEMKDDAFEREKHWAEKELEKRKSLQELQLKEQQEQLNLKIQEFTEITIPTRLLENIGELKNLQENLEKYKKEFDELKKQINDSVQIVISEKDNKNKE